MSFSDISPVAFDDIEPGHHMLCFVKQRQRLADVVGLNSEGRLMLRDEDGRETTIGRHGFGDMVADGYLVVLGGGTR